MIYVGYLHSFPPAARLASPAVCSSSPIPTQGPACIKIQMSACQHSRSGRAAVGLSIDGGHCKLRLAPDHIVENRRQRRHADEGCGEMTRDHPGPNAQSSAVARNLRRGRKAAVDANVVSRKSYLFASEQANVGPIHRNVHGIPRCMTVGCSHDIVRVSRFVFAAASDWQLVRARQRLGSRESDRVIDAYLDSASGSWSSVVFIAHSMGAGVLEQQHAV